MLITHFQTIGRKTSSLFNQRILSSKFFFEAFNRCTSRETFEEKREAIIVLISIIGSEYPEAGEVLVWWVCLSQSYSSKIQRSKSQCGHRLKTGKTVSLTAQVATEEAGHSEEAKHQRHSITHFS